MNNERSREVLKTILLYIKNGQSLNDVIERTNVREKECLEALDIIEKTLKI